MNDKPDLKVVDDEPEETHEVEEYDESGLDEFASQPVPLGEAALTAIGDVIGDDAKQEAFDGMEDITKVKFVGMAYDSVDNSIKLGDEVTFVVRARCTAETKELVHDMEREVRKMDVQSVIVKE